MIMDKFRLLFEMSPDPIFVENYEGTILEANQAACEMHGIEYDKLIGRNFIDFIPEEYHDYVKNNFDTFIKEGKKVVESHAIDKNSKNIDIEITVNTIIFENERCILLHIRDISKRKKAERELKESQDQLRKLTEHLQSVREMESSKIARDLHDVLGQDLTAMKFELSYIAKKSTDYALADKTLALIELTNKMLDTIRRIATDLRPTVLDNIGLGAALDWLIMGFESKTNITTYYENNISSKIPKRIETEIYRIVQEALTNIRRHSHADEVNISLNESENYFEIMVSDNGKGFNNSDTNHSLGLLGMKERARNINAGLEIISKLGNGTTIKLKVSIND